MSVCAAIVHADRRRMAERRIAAIDIEPELHHLLFLGRLFATSATAATTKHTYDLVRQASRQ
jgi:hypothetical protein